MAEMERELAKREEANRDSEFSSKGPAVEVHTPNSEYYKLIPDFEEMYESDDYDEIYDDDD